MAEEEQHADILVANNTAAQAEALEMGEEDEHLGADVPSAARAPLVASSTPAQAGAREIYPPNRPQNQQREPLWIVLAKMMVMLCAWAAFTRSFNQGRLERDRQSMNDVEKDLAEQNLQPLTAATTPPDIQEVSKIKELLGVQSRHIQRFPEYDQYDRRIALHRCTFKPHQKVSHCTCTSILKRCTHRS
jgi:hypothetical protein